MKMDFFTANSTVWLCTKVRNNIDFLATGFNLIFSYPKRFAVRKGGKDTKMDPICIIMCTG